MCCISKFTVGADDVVHELSVDEKFTHFVDAPAPSRALMSAAPTCRVCSCDIMLMIHPGQTDHHDLFAKVTETVQVDVVTDIMGAAVRKELLKVANDW